MKPSNILKTLAKVECLLCVVVLSSMIPPGKAKKAKACNYWLRGRLPLVFKMDRKPGGGNRPFNSDAVASLKKLLTLILGCLLGCIAGAILASKLGQVV